MASIAPSCTAFARSASRPSASSPASPGAAAGDPDRVRRLAVRFASPAFIGDDLDVHLYDMAAGAIAFEATSSGTVVLGHGRAELR
jgi:hypothetical protein